MKITRYPLVALLGILFIVVSGAAAHADTTYTYSGNPFTDFTGAAGCSQPSTGQESSDTCSISGFFTVGQPLAANLFDAQITPTDWNFTDGFGVWNPGGFVLFPPSSSTFVISTDSSGNITNWAISLGSFGHEPAKHAREHHSFHKQWRGLHGDTTRRCWRVRRSLECWCPRHLDHDYSRPQWRWDGRWRDNRDSRTEHPDPGRDGNSGAGGLRAMEESRSLARRRRRLTRFSQLLEG